MNLKGFMGRGGEGREKTRERTAEGAITATEVAAMVTV